MQKEDISLLRIYAKNDMNCVKTEKEMDIHHNSVIYRLGKIKTALNPTSRSTTSGAREPMQPQSARWTPSRCATATTNSNAFASTSSALKSWTLFLMEKKTDGCLRSRRTGTIS